MQRLHPDSSIVRLDEITPFIITRDEAANIGRVLDSLRWATRILVLDSGSADATIEIASAYPQVAVRYRPFDTFAAQCNAGLEHIASEWVLSLDADYVLSDDLVTELGGLAPTNEICGYRAAFVYKVHGRPLRGTLYPPRTVLYRRDRARYRDFGHGHRVIVDGRVTELSGRIFHDDRKPLSRFIASQQRYAAREAAYILETDKASLSRADRIRRMGWPAPVAVFLYTYFAKGCFLDGWAGWHYVLQRTLAETIIALEVVDRRSRQRQTDET